MYASYVCDSIRIAPHMYELHACAPAWRRFFEVRVPCLVEIYELGREPKGVLLGCSDRRLLQSKIQNVNEIANQRILPERAHHVICHGARRGIYACFIRDR